jgi:hypothetical protein
LRGGGTDHLLVPPPSKSTCATQEPRTPKVPDLLAPPPSNPTCAAPDLLAPAASTLGGDAPPPSDPLPPRLTPPPLLATM